MYFSSFPVSADINALAWLVEGIRQRVSFHSDCAYGHYQALTPGMRVEDLVVRLVPCLRGGTTAAERCVLFENGPSERYKETQQIIKGKGNLNIIMIANRQFIKQNQKG